MLKDHCELDVERTRVLPLSSRVLLTGFLPKKCRLVSFNVVRRVADVSYRTVFYKVYFS